MLLNLSPGHLIYRADKAGENQRVKGNVFFLDVQVVLGLLENVPFLNMDGVTVVSPYDENESFLLNTGVSGGVYTDIIVPFLLNEGVEGGVSVSPVYSRNFLIVYLKGLGVPGALRLTTEGTGINTEVVRLGSKVRQIGPK